jgi:nucleoside-diphosphate-sugar epimerase
LTQFKVDDIAFAVIIARAFIIACALIAGLVILRLGFRIMKNILVTGGAGFIGSHTCKALWRTGYNPITFDNLERGHAWAVKWGPFERGDLRNPTHLRGVFEKWKPWAVVHFAAYAYVGESTTAPAM